MPRGCTCSRIGCPVNGEGARALARDIVANAPAGPPSASTVAGLCFQLMEDWVAWDGCWWRMGLCHGPCGRPCCAPARTAGASSSSAGEMPLGGSPVILPPGRGTDAELR
eukprot:5646489-Alexandrium_andersonii.AAC.1